MPRARPRLLLLNVILFALAGCDAPARERPAPVEGGSPGDRDAAPDLGTPKRIPMH